MSDANEQIVVSLTTYPKRMEYFKRSFTNLLTLDGMERVWKIVVVLDDNLADGQYAEYDEFLKQLDERIEIVRNDHRWKCANKMVPTYNRYGQEHPIVLFDDDKGYPKTCLTELTNASLEHNNCIISQEINPLYIGGDSSFNFANSLDVKLLQTEWGKYFSNACYFPPKCFGDGKLLNDYDKFKYITEGNQDELWFWIVSTLNRVPCVGLDCTFSYELDENVTYEMDDTALTRINANRDTVDGYNRRMNELFGKELVSVVNENPVRFEIHRSNYSAVLYGLGAVNAVYARQPIDFVFDRSLPRSYISIFANSVQRMKWYAKVNVRVCDKE